MTEPRCPYCGRVMELIEGPEYLLGSKQCYWYSCPACTSLSPTCDTPEQALAAANQRCTPPAQPLTLTELMALERPWPVWVEINSRRIKLTLPGFKDSMKPSTLMRLHNIEEGIPKAYAAFEDNAGRRLDLYGKLWRCWLARPTDAEREAAPWEEGK